MAIKCNTHNQTITGYEVRTQFTEINGRMMRVVESYVFDCGCLFDAASIDAETVVGQDVTNDGTYLVELTIRDMTGEPIMSWVESRYATNVY
ncbi:hypothetical protein [Micromonospora globbae]|uniref:Uncharacterized protein n=1 Tax=Micromonospora globbae TaxID=1894969 RepID=A0A420F1J5_9ACTN|nr:hypothetical protein [Micromonospora globbae]RKF26852.1 hypothetical protein D7I43_12910 [Micromonospora globbae]